MAIVPPDNGRIAIRPYNYRFMSIIRYIFKKIKDNITKFQKREEVPMEHKHFEGYSSMRERCLRRDDDAEFADELGVDTTAYPEFIASFNNWMSKEHQKQRAGELSRMTRAEPASKPTSQVRDN